MAACPRLGVEAEVRFLGDLAAGNLIAETVVAADWLRIAELVSRHRDLPLGTTDASVFAAAVDTARRMGRSWEEIADAIGIKGQSAWAKYRTKVLTAADVVFSGRRIRAKNLRVRCARCGDTVFELKASGRAGSRRLPRRER